MLKLLFITMDTFPPFRADVKVLFGMKLASRGHQIDWLLQSEDACPRSYTINWLNSRVLVARTNKGEDIFSRVKKHYYAFKNELKIFS